jgi:hypothetical protein
VTFKDHNYYIAYYQKKVSCINFSPLNEEAKKYIKKNMNKGGYFTVRGVIEYDSSIFFI